LGDLPAHSETCPRFVVLSRIQARTTSIRPRTLDLDARLLVAHLR
jgi:hypothetical protein